jgi:hypothetical protein
MRQNYDRQAHSLRLKPPGKLHNYASGHLAGTFVAGYAIREIADLVRDTHENHRMIQQSARVPESYEALVRQARTLRQKERFSKRVRMVNYRLRAAVPLDLKVAESQHCKLHSWRMQCDAFGCH